MQTTTYSIQTGFKNGPASYSLAFWNNPLLNMTVPKSNHFDNTKLSHAKKTLARCRKHFPHRKHAIVKKVLKVEILDY